MTRELKDWLAESMAGLERWERKYGLDSCNHPSDYLCSKCDPVLAKLWDNPDDDIWDSEQ